MNLDFEMKELALEAGINLFKEFDEKCRNFKPNWNSISTTEKLGYFKQIEEISKLEERLPEKASKRIREKYGL